MKKPLSPAAEKVWNAFNDVYERTGTFEDFGDALAAALQAVADEVAPVEYELLDGHLQYEKCNPIREQLLTITEELES